jgi:hypothetical protein
MMNRERLTRGRPYTNNQTRLGLPERVESAILGLLITVGLGALGWVIFWVMIILAVFLTVMALMRPDYRLPFISNLIDRMV